MFDTVLIANRGEIACRVIRTCRSLGVRTVAVFSEADADALHVRMADMALPIGGPRPADSYLRIDAILEAARESGAQAIHPGYGFLSENAAFARACDEAGIVFIGPKAESIDAMGSKAQAKALMQHHGVPLVPGYHGEDQAGGTLARQAVDIGFPLMIKPASGGGGKGMRIVHTEGDFAAALESAQREAENAFGDQRMILERYIEHPRHIEFQVFGDSHGEVIHLNERECSAQRRYQKVLEETPSPFLDDERRAAMGAAAVAAAKAVDYLGAGTVEFIVDPQGEFYFMEMNTRLQVEHPVTEMTLGLDLVEWQLRIADGEALPLQQEQVQAHGHAIEVRLYAEDPEHDFMPGSGRLTRLDLPQTDAHVRVDAGVQEGDTVSIHYDPMIAKLIVREDTRRHALVRLREALAGCEIVGPKSNIAFLERLVRHPAIAEARIDTGYLDRHLEEFLPADAPAPAADVFAAATATLVQQERAATIAASGHEQENSPWNPPDAWRIGHHGKRLLALLWRGQRYDIEAHGHAGDYALAWQEQACQVRGARLEKGVLTARFDELARRINAHVEARRVRVQDREGVRRIFELAPVFAPPDEESGGGDRIVAPMPGRIVVVRAAPGDAVEQGQELLVMEAMKMELSLSAPRAGEVESVHAAQDDFVEADTVLVSLICDDP